MLATAVIVFGVVLATAFGTHCESEYKPEQLISLYSKLPFIIMAGAISGRVSTVLAIICRDVPQLISHILLLILVRSYFVSLHLHRDLFRVLHGAKVAEGKRFYKAISFTSNWPTLLSPIWARIRLILCYFGADAAGRAGVRRA